MHCLSSGNKSATPFPDPFPVWRCARRRGEIESVCFFATEACFFSPKSHSPPFSPSVKLRFQAGVTEHSAQAAGGPGKFVCPKNMF